MNHWVIEKYRRDYYNKNVATKLIRKVILYMNIGGKIKALRKDKDITQEKLASYLNVSCQAISKWENGTASPDISLIIPIANFFNISIDELFDRDAEKIKTEIEDFLKQASYLSQRGRVREEIKLWEVAVSKFPNNYLCLTQYADALFSAKFSDDFDNDEKIADEYTAKSLKICEQILEDCTENEYRSSAIQTLVMIYGNPGRGYYDEEKAENYAKQADDLYCCSDILLESAYKVNSEKHLAQKHSNAKNFVDMLTCGIVLGKYKDSNEKIFALKTALKIWNALFYDGNFLFFHGRIAEIYRNLAIEYAKIRNKKEVIENLKLAKKHAQARERLSEGKHFYTSIFLNKAYFDSSRASKNFSCSEIDIISKILSYNIFDFMRETKEFIEFKKSLYD